MPWQATIAKGTYRSVPMTQSGGGDADVFTKNGRQTRVELSTSNIRHDDQGKNILVDVHYSVRELHANYTFLTSNGTASLPIPEDARKHSVVIKDSRNYGGSWLVKGQMHSSISLGDTGNTIILGGFYTIDGPGDDLINAGVQIDLEVPVQYFDTN